MGVKLSLRKKDYGLPLGKTIDKVATYPYYYHRFSKKGTENDKYEYKASFQRVDGNQLRLRRGDMIRFSSGDWTGGFRKDIRGEYGVILERYRIIKRKINGTFKDYYAVVLITSGKLKGQLQHVGCHKLSSLSKHI
jgi:hypothetical protein